MCGAEHVCTFVPVDHPITFDFDRAGRHLTVYVSGELDIGAAKELEQAVLEHHRPTDERVWLDLGALTFCDSSGVAALFRLHRAVEAEGTHFVLYDPPPTLREVLRLADPDCTLKVRTGSRRPS